MAEIKAAMHNVSGIHLYRTVRIISVSDLLSSSPSATLRSILLTTWVPRGSAQKIASNEFDAEKADNPISPTYVRTSEFTIRPLNI